jgi:hypothetical protein
VAALCPPAFVPVPATSVVLASSITTRQTSERDPARAALVERVGENLLKDDLVNRLYRYRLHRRTYDVSLLGKVSNGPERVFEVQPSPVDPGRGYLRLVAENGRPLSSDEARRYDERLRREQLEEKRRRDGEPGADRARRERQEARERQEQRARLDDALRVFRIEFVGYEELDGRRLLIASLTPQTGARTTTPEGRLMKKAVGRAWVDEDAGQLARLEMNAVDDIPIGLGIIGRIARDSRGTYERAPLPDGAWVPVELRFVGSGRTLLFRPFEIETWAKYSDYRPVRDSHLTSQESREP